MPDPNVTFDSRLMHFAPLYSLFVLLTLIIYIFPLLINKIFCTVQYFIDNI